MEQFKEVLKKSGVTAIVESIVFAILGLILIIQPDTVMSIIAYVLGGIFIAAGIIKILSYIQQKGQKDLYNYELIFGIISAVVGIVIIKSGNQISQIFGMIIGMWIIYSSVVRFGSALKLKSTNTNIWLYSIAIAFVMFLIGLYLVLGDGALIVTIGIIMIVYSVLDIIENVIFINNIKKL